MVTGDICQGSAQKEGEYTRHLVWAVGGSALGVVKGAFPPICQGSAQKEGEYTSHLVWAFRGSALGVVTGDICQGECPEGG